MAREHVNCPVCGRVGDSSRFAAAGSHAIEVK